MYDTNDEMVNALSRGSVFYSISVDDIREILDTYYPKSSTSKWKRIHSNLKHAYRRSIQHSLTLNGESDDHSDLDDLNIHESTYIYSAGLTCRQYTHSNTVPRVHIEN
eukprot:834164_1